MSIEVFVPGGLKLSVSKSSPESLEFDHAQRVDYHRDENGTERQKNGQRDIFGKLQIAGDDIRYSDNNVHNRKMGDKERPQKVGIRDRIKQLTWTWFAMWAAPQNHANKQF